MQASTEALLATANLSTYRGAYQHGRKEGFLAGHFRGAKYMSKNKISGTYADRIQEYEGWIIEMQGNLLES